MTVPFPTTSRSRTGERAPHGKAPVLALRDVFRIYREQDIETVALRGATLEVDRGEFVAIVGRSGSGKSTLLSIAAGLTTPSAGSVLVDGQDIARLREEQRATLRRERLGIVFQNANLIPWLSALENVEVALSERQPARRRQRARALLERVGLDARRNHYPPQLSGGEQQRVAIAIALANEPTLLLADELTGELDAVTTTMIMRLLAALHRERGMAIVLVTHNLQVAAHARRIVEMRDGLLIPYHPPAPFKSLAPSLRPSSFSTEIRIEATHLTRTYPGGVQALQDTSLHVHAGESVAVMGPSGCGKSTLLHLLGGLDRPTAGDVRLNGQSLTDLRADDLALIRRRTIGVIFQSHNLLPTLTALENVALPLMLDQVPLQEREGRARELLARVGLGDEMEKMPDQLSGGQRQRVAIARSLAHRPSIVLADEPTGNLDSEQSGQVTDVLVDLARTEQLALVLVTHDPHIAAACQRTIHLRDGQLVERPDGAGEGPAHD